MRSPKKRTRPSQTPVVLYPRDIRRIKQEISDKMLALVTAYCMDELDYDENKIVDFWESIARYADAIKEHDITLRKVKEIITENTGINLLGYREMGNE